MTDQSDPGVYRSRGPVDGEDWTAVAQALNARMATRRLGQQDLAQESGVSVSTLRLLQHGAGRRVQNRTLIAIARALGWPDDQLVRVLIGGAGGESETSGGEVVQELRVVQEQLLELTRQVAALRKERG